MTVPLIAIRSPRHNAIAILIDRGHPCKARRRLRSNGTCGDFSTDPRPVLIERTARSGQLNEAVLRTAYRARDARPAPFRSQPWLSRRLRNDQRDIACDESDLPSRTRPGHAVKHPTWTAARTARNVPTRSIAPFSPSSRLFTTCDEKRMPTGSSVERPHRKTRALAANRTLGGRRRDLRPIINVDQVRARSTSAGEGIRNVIVPSRQARIK